MVRIMCGSRFLPSNSRVKTKKKKRFSARNFRLSLGVHSFFRPGTKLFSRLGGHKQYFVGAQAPKCTPVAPACYFLSEHTSRLGSTAPKCPQWRRACANRRLFTVTNCVRLTGADCIRVEGEQLICNNQGRIIRLTLFNTVYLTNGFTRSEGIFDFFT